MDSDLTTLLSWTREHWEVLASVAFAQMFLAYVVGKLVMAKSETRLRAIVELLKRRGRE